MTDRYHARKGDDALVITDRDDLAPESFLGKTGHVLAVNPDGDCLLKIPWSCTARLVSSRQPCASLRFVSCNNPASRVAGPVRAPRVSRYARQSVRPFAETLAEPFLRKIPPKPVALAPLPRLCGATYCLRVDRHE